MAGVTIRRVVAVGLDGLERRIVQRLLETSQLPNLARLSQQGGFGTVATTYPAQTPVAWSTFSTGVNPGAHGIFDFVRRDPRTYQPDLALNRYEQKNAFSPPRAVNLRGGKPVWEVLSDAGIGSTILRMPCAYPPNPFRGRLLCGMGVPDIRGGLGTSSSYSSDPPSSRSTEAARLEPEAQGRYRVTIKGPRNPRTGADFTAQIVAEANLGKRTMVIRGEGKGQPVEIREGGWSDWLRVRFKTGLLQSIAGMVRFHLIQLEPTVELYASPVNFDIGSPMFPISHPESYAQELERAVGTFYTTGMVEDHGALDHDRFNEAAYLEQCTQTMAERERMLRFELDRFDNGFLFCLFDTPDRLQHMFWRFGEPDHPANQQGMDDLGSVIDDHYRECDRMVGRILESCDEQTLLIVLSDHGMNSFRRGVNLNTWLHRQGLLALRDGVSANTEAQLADIDWDRTQAYSLGLAGIYINQRGREERGQVSREDAAALAARVAAALSGFADPQSGSVAVRSAVPSATLYRGAFAAGAPDVVVNFAYGYRSSWSTALGGVPQELVEDNRKKWSGDHIIDPELVPGVLFMNRPFRQDGPSLLDLGPTILEALGVPVEAQMEGRPLLV